MKKLAVLAVMSLMLSGQAYAQSNQQEKTEEMEQISPKDYTTFKVSDNVTLYRVIFKTQYKMDVELWHLLAATQINPNHERERDFS